MATVKVPSGLTITRSTLSMACEWKRGTSYTAQQFEYKINDGDWVSQSVTGSATSKTISLTASSYYPTTTTKITTFSFRVRGKKSKWSKWTEYPFTFNVPNRPFTEATPDSQLSNKCAFSWNLETSTEGSQHFAGIQYQTMLVSNCDTTDGSKLNWTSSATGWQTGTNSSNNSSIEITESSVSTGTHTRWFRVRSRGVAGDSAWNYSKRVYASPNAASDVKASATLTGSSGTDILVTWNAQESAARPIDSATVEYTSVTPAASLACPSGATWTSGTVSADTKGSDNALLKIDSRAGEDTCIYVRVNTVHEDRITYGTATLASIGYLKSPTLTSVTPNYTNGTVSFTVATTTTVPGSYIEAFYRTASKPNITESLGTIANNVTTKTFTIPNLSGESAVGFGIRSRVDGAGQVMKSADIWTTSSVPTAPTSLTLAKTNIAGTISAKWVWSWAAATGLELSWADHEDAWYSTDEPETYKVSDTHATEWRISGLETGKKWYVRVRLVQETEETTVYSPWSTIEEIDLSSQPAIPTLALSQGVVPITGEVTAYWTFLSGDGTLQVYAEVCEATISGNTITYGSIIAHTQSAQQVTIKANRWNAGTTHHLCVRTLSGSNQRSEWSAPVSVQIASPLTATISATSLSSGNLTALPFTATITGAGAGGTTTLAIERADDYHVERPDETDYTGYKGETIALFTQMGESQITITRDMLLGSLDDGARYTIVATVQDGLGQSAEKRQNFTVAWSHQAAAPTGTVTMIDTAAKIKATAPSNYVSGDTCDIYRLSADSPELVVKGAAFGTDYVDPYPAIGGGYRFVTVTANGDYINASNEFAWVDVLSGFTYDQAIIDFDGKTVNLAYNIDLSSTWSKDFQHTRYLGGSIAGDWNVGVYREMSVSTVSVATEDAETIELLRDLAEYTGICNIRTQDGSSFKANLDVTEARSYQHAGKVVEFTIAAQRIDPDELDGITYALWNS